MKKFLGLIMMCGMLLLVSGCDINYNVSIGKQLDVTEEIVGLEPVSKYAQFSTMQYGVAKDMKWYSDANEFDVYQYQVEQPNEEQIGGKATRKYETVADYVKHSQVIHNTDSTLKVVENKKEVTLIGTANYGITNQNPLYTDFTKVNVNIKVTSPVISSNADSNNGNTYTWVLTKDKPKRDIEIVMKNEKKYPTNWGPLVLILFTVVIGVFGFFFVRKQNESANKM